VEEHGTALIVPELYSMLSAFGAQLRKTHMDLDASTDNGVDLPYFFHLHNCCTKILTTY
jgi:hypothetical protein